MTGKTAVSTSTAPNTLLLRREVHERKWMEIESFFPGRIRISSKLFREQENVEKAKSLVGSREGIKSVSENLRAGSLTIVYDPAAITVDMLLEAKAEIERWERA